MNFITKFPFKNTTGNKVQGPIFVADIEVFENTLKAYIPHIFYKQCNVYHLEGKN